MDSINLKNLSPLLPKGWQKASSSEIEKFNHRRHRSDITPIRHSISFPFVNENHEVIWQSDPFCIGNWCLPRFQLPKLSRLFSKKGGKNINKTKKYRKIKR
jgi:hypothetical protein